MKTVQIKTTLKCQGCVDAAKPHLDANENIKSWKVDLSGPVKILHAEVEDGKSETVIESLKAAGYDGEVQA